MCSSIEHFGGDFRFEESCSFGRFCPMTSCCPDFGADHAKQTSAWNTAEAGQFIRLYKIINPLKLSIMFL